MNLEGFVIGIIVGYVGMELLSQSIGFSSTSTRIIPTIPKVCRKNTPGCDVNETVIPNMNESSTHGFTPREIWPFGF